MAGEFQVPVPGGSITGWLGGDGQPVLVLHGGPGLSDYTAPLAAELTDAFAVIRYQQRGLAPSVTSGPFDIGQHVADVSKTELRNFLLVRSSCCLPGSPFGALTGFRQSLWVVQVS